MYPYWSVGITNPLLVFNFITLARERANVEIYAPRYTKRQYIRRANTHKDVSRPAFGGYFFARVENQDTPFALLKTTIACSLLRLDGQFVKVRDSEVEMLRELEASNALVPEEGEVKLKFENGKIIVVKHGAMAGKKAKMIHNINDKLVMAEIDGKKIKIPLYFFKELAESEKG